MIGQAFSFVAGSLHVGFFYLESFLFPSSPSVQKLFLGRRAEDKELVKSVQPFLFNQGFYNLFLALGNGREVGIFFFFFVLPFFFRHIFWPLRWKCSSCQVYTAVVHWCRNSFVRRVVGFLALFVGS
jgi:uncharacterized membrane protein